MQFRNFLGVAFLCCLTSACVKSEMTDNDIEAQPEASREQWKAINATVHDFEGMAPTPVEKLGTNVQHLHTKMCLSGMPAAANAQMLMNKLKYKAFSIEATGLTHVEMHIVPWGGNRPAHHRCAYGYIEASGIALVLDKSQFPGLYPE